MKLTRRRLRRLIEGLIMEEPGSGGLSAAGTLSGGGDTSAGLGPIGPSAKDLERRSQKTRKAAGDRMAKKRADRKEVDSFMAGLDFEGTLEPSDMKVFVVMQPDKKTVQTWGTYAEQDGEYFYVEQEDYKGADSDWKKLPRSGVKNIQTKYKDRISPVVVFRDGESKPKGNKQQPGYTFAMAMGKEKIKKA